MKIYLSGFSFMDRSKITSFNCHTVRDPLILKCLTSFDNNSINPLAFLKHNDIYHPQKIQTTQAPNNDKINLS